MILLSFSSAVKYVLGLMLAILGYIPFEQSEKPVSPQIEKIIIVDSLQTKQFHIITTDSIGTFNSEGVQVIFIPNEIEPNVEN